MAHRVDVCPVLAIGVGWVSGEKRATVEVEADFGGLNAIRIADVKLGTLLRLARAFVRVADAMEFEKGRKRR